MYKVKISVTVSRTKLDKQFKGLITFKNENKETSFDYLCTDPDGERIDLEFSNKDGKFEVKGIPSEKLLETLSDNQKLIFAMSIESLSSAISNAQNLSLSHKTTELLRMCDGDVSGEMNFGIEVGEVEYSCLFGNFQSSVEKNEEPKVEEPVCPRCGDLLFGGDCMLCD